VALLAVANWLNHRSGKVSAAIEASDEAKSRVLVD
jgi:AAT family amino acid transporter